MTENITDFSDYAKPFDFKYEGNIYRIPPFNKPQLEALMHVNAEFIKEGNKNNKVDETNDDDDAPESSYEDASESNMKYLNVQEELILIAVKKKSLDSYIALTSEDIIDWPIKLKNRLSKAINDQISSTLTDKEDEGDAEKKS